MPASPVRVTIFGEAVPMVWSRRMESREMAAAGSRKPPDYSGGGRSDFRPTTVVRAPRPGIFVSSGLRFTFSEPRRMIVAYCLTT